MIVCAYKCMSMHIEVVVYMCIHHFGYNIIAIGIIRHTEFIHAQMTRMVVYSSKFYSQRSIHV